MVGLKKRRAGVIVAYRRVASIRDLVCPFRASRVADEVATVQLVIAFSQLQRATGLSLRYASLIRRGERTPHPRHWPRSSEPAEGTAR